MGLVPPPGPLGARHDFTIEDTDLILRLAPDGQAATLEGTLGALTPDPHEATAQLRKLLRLGLGLAGFNRAALVLPDVNGADAAGAAALMALADRRPDQPPLRVTAQARIAPGDPRAAVAALEDILQWRSFARDVIPASAEPATAAAHPASPATPPDSGADFVIFQP